MPSAREMRMRIRSVKNIAQVTKALETVSASKVRRAVAAYTATHPYADKAASVLAHLARQPAHASLHPLLVDRPEIRNTLVVMVSGDRGLAGAYNANILRFTLDHFHSYRSPVHYVAVGRKGRDMLIRRRKNVTADFSNLPANPSFVDVSAIGQLVMEEYLEGRADEVFLVYTNFRNMISQQPMLQQLLPFDVEARTSAPAAAQPNGRNYVFTYEPDGAELLDQIVRRFTAIQVFQAILSAQASEHAARMVAMRNATDSANELIGVLQLDYNKVRQQTITNDMIDITGGAEAQQQNS